MMMGVYWTMTSPPELQSRVHLTVDTRETLCGITVPLDVLGYVEYWQERCSVLCEQCHQIVKRKTI